MRLARHQFKYARCGRSEDIGEGGVAQREVLSIIPQRSYRIAIKVAHDRFRGGESALSAWSTVAGGFNKAVHTSLMVRFLFSTVTVGLVGRQGVVAIDTKRVWGAGGRLLKAVDKRRVGQRIKTRGAWWVGCMWVSAEIMIKGNILIEKDDQVLNWGAGFDGCLRYVGPCGVHEEP